MKHTNIIIALLIVFSFNGCTERTLNKNLDIKLNALLEQKDYFKLRELIESNEAKLSEDRVLYYKAFITKAFGENKKSNEYIETLLNKHKSNLNDSTLLMLLDLKATNCLYNYDYKQASEIYLKILTDYNLVIDSLEKTNYINVKNLFGALADINPQIITKKSTVKINSYRNQFNHLMTPVKSNSVTEDFIFDTGANLSTISESQAKKMDLTIIDQNVDVGSSTQISIQSKLAVADTFYIGEILFENVVFLVMPDNQLDFPEINYQIHGIIGFPVIHQFGEVHLHKDGSITVPNDMTEKKLNNLFFEGLNPVVRLFSLNDTLLFTFDTGAKSSELSYKYYNDHKTEIEKYGKLRTNERGGAGGISNVKEYILENFPMRIGTKPLSLSSVPVALEEYEFNKSFDGNMGQDVFTQFNTLVINFKYMYVDFE